MNNVLRVLIAGLLVLGSSAALGNYEALSACDKQQEIWPRIQATKYVRLPAITGGWADLLTSIRSALFLSETFDHTSDFMPRGRTKIIHGSGSVGIATWQTVSHSPFSGLYSDTTACALVRLSLAAKTQTFGVTPALAIKIFIDGQPSQNLQLMHSLNGQGTNTNFFAHTFTNHLPAPRGFIFNALNLALAVTGRDLRRVDVDHVSRVTVSGARVAGVAPRQLAAVPLVSLPSNSRNDFRADLATIPAGTALYAIHGLDSAGVWQNIGTLTLDSTLVASEFGDKNLFFRHQQR